MPFLYKNKIHRFSCIDFLFDITLSAVLWMYYQHIALLLKIRWETLTFKWSWIDQLERLYGIRGRGGGCCLTKYILKHFCNNETSFSYRIDFYYTYWFDDFLLPKKQLKTCIRLAYISCTCTYILFYAMKKCFEIPICTHNLNKQDLVNGSGFLIDVHGTHGL